MVDILHDVVAQPKDASGRMEMRLELSDLVIRTAGLALPYRLPKRSFEHVPMPAQVSTLQVVIRKAWPRFFEHVLALSANGAAGLTPCSFLLFSFLPRKMDLCYRCCVLLLLFVGCTTGLNAWPEYGLVC